MDSDGYNHRYLTKGDAMVLTPDIAPKGQQIAFVSYADGRPAVRIMDIGSGAERPVLTSDAIVSPRAFRPMAAASPFR